MMILAAYAGADHDANDVPVPFCGSSPCFTQDRQVDIVLHKRLDPKVTLQLVPQGKVCNLEVRGIQDATSFKVCRTWESNAKRPYLGRHLLHPDATDFMDPVDWSSDTCLDELKQSIRIVVVLGGLLPVVKPLRLAVHQGHIRLRPTKIEDYVEVIAPRDRVAKLCVALLRP